MTPTKSALLLSCTLVAGLFAGNARSASLDDYLGSFVGEATVSTPGSNEIGERDIDIVISRPQESDLRIEWVNVDRVDGRRDVPGVKRRAGVLDFERVANGDYLIESTAFDPFRERDELAPIAGDPVRWAYLGEDGLRVFSFVILDDGSYEVQTYVRSLDGDRLDLQFERVVDGEMKRQISGRAQRTD